MGIWNDFFTTLRDISYQERLQKEANISQEEFDETVKSAIHRLALDKGEQIIYHDFTIYMEPRAVREYVSGRAGIRLAKGIWIGGTRGHAESHQELRKMDYGTLTITNKRLIFTGKFKGQNLTFNKISFINTYSDAIQVGSISRQHTMYFSASNGLLPYLAIKDVKRYNEIKQIYDYFRFLLKIPNFIEQIQITGKHDTSILIEKSKEIDNVAGELKTEYKKFHMKLTDLQKVNKDVEDLINIIHSIAKTLRFISNEAELIERQAKKERDKSKGFLGIFKPSVNSLIVKIFEERYKTSPQKFIQKEVNRMNSLLDVLGEHVKDSTDLLSKHLSPISE